MKLDFYVVPLILVDTLNAVEGAGLNVRPTNEQLQLDSKQTKSIWRIIIQMLFILQKRRIKLCQNDFQYQHLWERTDCIIECTIRKAEKLLNATWAN